MPTRKESPPADEKLEKSEKQPTKTVRRQTREKATEQRKTATRGKKPVAEKKTDPQAKEGKTPQKERPRSPINGVPLPEGRRFSAGEQAREAARKGGLKSAQNKKARKTLREELLYLLTVKVPDENGKERTQQEAISVALLKAAQDGNVRAFETIRDTIGEKFAEHVDVTMTNSREKLDSAFDRMFDGSEAP